MKDLLKLFSCVPRPALSTSRSGYSKGCYFVPIKIITTLLTTPECRSCRQADISPRNLHSSMPCVPRRFQVRNCRRGQGAWVCRMMGSRGGVEFNSAIMVLLYTQLHHCHPTSLLKQKQLNRGYFQKIKFGKQFDCVQEEGVYPFFASFSPLTENPLALNGS